MKITPHRPCVRFRQPMRAGRADYRLLNTVALARSCPVLWVVALPGTLFGSAFLPHRPDGQRGTLAEERPLRAFPWGRPVHRAGRHGPETGRRTERNGSQRRRSGAGQPSWSTEARTNKRRTSGQLSGPYRVRSCRYCGPLWHAEPGVTLAAWNAQRKRKRNSSRSRAARS
jgi:hypothetical protein